MNRNDISFGNESRCYREQGFAIVPMIDERGTEDLQRFAEMWVYGLLEVNATEITHYPIGLYHLWHQKAPVLHNTAFRAANRHVCPNASIRQILVNARLDTFLKELGVRKFRIWDEGYGWLGFRIIRPGFGDGYPLSRKEWGPAKNVISIWVPIIGYNANETLRLIPGSHLKEYEKYLPENQKFCMNEYRLATPVSESELYSPDLRRGEVVVYHPKTLHTENIRNGVITRLSLEFRIEPVA